MTAIVPLVGTKRKSESQLCMFLMQEPQTICADDAHSYIVAVPDLLIFDNDHPDA